MIWYIILGIVIAILVYVIAWQRVRFNQTTHELEVTKDNELHRSWKMGYEAGYRQGDSDRALKNLGFNVPK